MSTTHVIAGSIAGVGSIQRLKAVRWGIAQNIAWAWILTSRYRRESARRHSARFACWRIDREL